MFVDLIMDLRLVLDLSLGWCWFRFGLSLVLWLYLYMACKSMHLHFLTAAARFDTRISPTSDRMGGSRLLEKTVLDNVGQTRYNVSAKAIAHAYGP